MCVVDPHLLTYTVGFCRPLAPSCTWYSTPAAVSMAAKHEKVTSTDIALLPVLRGRRSAPLRCCLSRLCSCACMLLYFNRSFKVTYTI